MFSPPSIHHVKIYRRKFTYKEEKSEEESFMVAVKFGWQSSSSTTSSFEHMESSSSSTSFQSSNDCRTFSFENSSPGMSQSNPITTKPARVTFSFTSSSIYSGSFLLENILSWSAPRHELTLCYLKKKD
jgi:hypothetical protein